MPNIAGWAYVVGSVVTGLVIVLLRDSIRNVVLWLWRRLRGRAPNDEAKQRVRDEKRERLRPRFEKAVDASEKMREATVNAGWGKTAESDKLMQTADEIFDSVRTQLLSEPEGEPIVELYDSMHNGYLEYRVRLQDQKLYRDALHPGLPELSEKVREQQNMVIGRAKQIRKTIHDTLKRLEP